MGRLGTTDHMKALPDIIGAQAGLESLCLARWDSLSLWGVYYKINYYKINRPFIFSSVASFDRCAVNVIPLLFLP